MPEAFKEKIKEVVRQRYGSIAAGQEQSCCGGGSSCSGDEAIQPNACNSEALGYSSADLEAIPEGSDLGLGCGNPQTIAGLKPGETVIDLGSGAGIDCFLAARQVGPSGHVIGIDMTHEMLEKAWGNAKKSNYENVEFRLGEIEHLPVADNTADALISNCVINLSPDKPQVYREAFRALKPGGRLAISDVVATVQLPDHIRRDLELHAGCMAGASYIPDVERMLKDAGFEKVHVSPKNDSKSFIKEWAPGSRIEDYVVSANIEAYKPKTL